MSDEKKQAVEGEESHTKEQATRRNFIKKAAYMTPVVLTLVAIPSFASAGSPGSGSGE